LLRIACVSYMRLQFTSDFRLPGGIRQHHRNFPRQLAQMTNSPPVGLAGSILATPK